MKIQIVGLELLWTVRQTDRHDEADIWFLQSCKYRYKLGKLATFLSL